VVKRKVINMISEEVERKMADMVVNQETKVLEEQEIIHYSSNVILVGKIIR
jgi:hypothetical protein